VPNLDKLEASLQRTSRRGAFISLAGFVIVLATLLGAAAVLRKLQAQLSDLEQQIKTKRAMISDLDRQRESLEAETKQLAAARDTARTELKKVNQKLDYSNDTLDRVRLQLAANSPATARQVLAQQKSTDTHTHPRLFIEIRSKDQESLYERCAEVLRPDVEVPGWELVATGPASAQMRYFHDEDKGEAENIASKVEGVIGYRPKTLHVGGYDLVPRRHFELWFSPKEATAQASEDAKRGAPRRSR